MVVDAVIFDFDDTLVATNIIYDEARERFFVAMERLGCLDREAMGEFLNDTDIKYVRELGFLANDCFPRAMRATYEHFVTIAGGTCDAVTADTMEQIAWDVYERETEFMEGARELLEKLQGRVRLFLLTQGDKDTQLKRLQMSGLLQYFDDFRIVPVKTKNEYQEFIAEMNIDASRSWMVGNSLRHDVNPAISTGLKAAHYKIPAWDFEHEEPLGEYDTLNNLTDFLELISL
jgi:putative hydrolase of the HAD superfamily